MFRKRWREKETASLDRIFVSDKKVAAIHQPRSLSMKLDKKEKRKEEGERGKIGGVEKRSKIGICPNLSK